MTHQDTPRAPLPPFSYEDAVQKVRMAEDAWNSRNPAKVALAYTRDTRWRNRDEFLNGRAEVEAFLTAKWAKENGYPLPITFEDDLIIYGLVLGKIVKFL